MRKIYFIYIAVVLCIFLAGLSCKEQKKQPLLQLSPLWMAGPIQYEIREILFFSEYYCVVLKKEYGSGYTLPSKKIPYKRVGNKINLTVDMLGSEFELTAPKTLNRNYGIKGHVPYFVISEEEANRLIQDFCIKDINFDNLELAL